MHKYELVPLRQGNLDQSDFHMTPDGPPIYSNRQATDRKPQTSTIGGPAVEESNLKQEDDNELILNSKDMRDA